MLGVNSFMLVFFKTLKLEIHTEIFIDETPEISLKLFQQKKKKGKMLDETRMWQNVDNCLAVKAR